MKKQHKNYRDEDKKVRYKLKKKLINSQILYFVILIIYNSYFQYSIIRIPDIL